MMGICEGIKVKQNYLFKGNYIFLPLIIVAGIMSLISCTKLNEFTIGGDFLESQTKLQIIDTFRVRLSTILLDSLTTSGTKIALAGSYSDNVFGSEKCEAYFDLKYESFSDIDEKAIYDSSNFIIAYSGYSYGDTTSLMTLSLHQLAEEIVPYDNIYLYNTSSFRYSPVALGSVSFYPSPNSSDTSIVLNVNSFGEELFRLIKEKDEKVSSDLFFSDYIKGFVLRSGNTDNKTVLGFKADKNNIVLKMYYHLDREEPELKTLTISLNEGNHQFNNIKYDLSNTLLSNIGANKNELAATQTGNNSYVQGAVGLLTKVQFPTLGEILAEKRWKILKAELVVEPVKSSYTLFKLPQQLCIYDTDKENRINSALKDSQGKAKTAVYENDELYNLDTRYTYDITNFIINELSDSYFDYYHGLLIGLDQDSYRSSLNRLLVENKKPPVKLKLYYLTY